MKRAIPLIIFSLLVFPVFSQKIVFVESQKAYEIFKSNKKKFKLSEEMSSGIRKNNGQINRFLALDIKKSQDLGVWQVDVSLNYTVYVNNKNEVDSLYFYPVRFLKTTLSGKTSYDMQYYPLGNQSVVSGLINIFKKDLKKYKFSYNPASYYELDGGLIVNQFTSKNIGAEIRAKGILMSLSDTTKKLNLSGLGLKELPKNINKFRNLEELNLSKNEFEVFKFNPSRFPNLKSIILTDNLLSQNSVKIRRNKSLKVINLSDNGFEAFPRRVQKSKGLLEIHLANNFIAETKSIRFRQLKFLVLLNFYNNQISELSEDVFLLKNLEILDLYHNNLKFLSKNINKLRKLETLAVSNNNLWELPSSLSKMSNLKILYAHHNKLTEIGNFPPNLEVLDLGFNLLETIPTSLENADKLTDLDISNNRIKAGAEVLLKLLVLKKVFLALNDFESEPTKFAELQQIIVDLEKKSVIVK